MEKGKVYGPSTLLKDCNLHLLQCIDRQPTTER